MFSLFAANILLKPFDRITSAINDIKAGFTNEEISVPDYLETEHIVTAFNQLLSRMKTLDESRQEFVSNVSHELKTPITSMKVLADTLVAQPDAPIEMYQDFMQDISKEVDREATIIDDLLSLVKMDKTAAQLNISTVDVNEMTEIILKRLRPIARKNNIELTFDSRRPVTAEIDEVKLSLAIMNIVENAIKYNKESGWVKVILDADHQSFTITISDSGVGIPEDSTDLIFNRFYRVDKSRSREIGGTGLGLSITKSAILMHRGSIDVDSVLGEGTTFTVTIPLSYAK
jgi:signal transduction histidine kinase